MFFRGPRADNHQQGQSATGNNAKTKKQAQGLFFVLELLTRFELVTLCYPKKTGCANVFSGAPCR